MCYWGAIRSGLSASLVYAGHGLEGAMLALTAGTFVYVGATEVITGRS